MPHDDIPNMFGRGMCNNQAFLNTTLYHHCIVCYRSFESYCTKYTNPHFNGFYCYMNLQWTIENIMSFTAVDIIFMNND